MGEVLKFRSKKAEEKKDEVRFITSNVCACGALMPKNHSLHMRGKPPLDGMIDMIWITFSCMFCGANHARRLKGKWEDIAAVGEEEG